MHPQICKIGPFTIYSYGLILAIAFMVSAVLARMQAKRQGINPDTIFNLLFLAFISGVIGARIFYVIENFGYYRKNPLEIIMLQQGGLSWFGGLILGAFFSFAYLRNKKLPAYKVLDLISPYLALAGAIGRIGCFLNGCCYGEIADFGIYFPAHGNILIPTQLYSSLALLAIFIILRILQERAHKDGQIFYAYLFLYSIKRFLIEFWRADNPAIFYGLTLFQLACIIIIILAIAKLTQINKT